MQSTSINMQRKPGFPVANCNIKMPDNCGISNVSCEDDSELQQRRLQLINFGHTQWGFNNWSWSVTKQELDFVDVTNGMYCAGVVAFVSVTVKNLDIHRENIGYATSNASSKGFAIYKSRKCAVTNALRETLLSFGGSVANELLELLESTKTELPTLAAHIPETQSENNQNTANKPSEPKNCPSNNKNVRKDSIDNTAHNMRSPHSVPVKNAAANAPVGVCREGGVGREAPPVARAHPMPGAPAGRPPAPRPPPPPLARPSSNDCKLEGAGGAGAGGAAEEDARAERKRRQRLAQEEFRLKQLMKNGTDDKQELNPNASSFDALLAEIPTQDIVIEETGTSAAEGKRKSPAPEGSAKRRANVSKLAIIQAD